MRIPSGGPAAPPVRATPRSEAARAAQKAFFDAARTNAAPSATAATAQTPIRPVSPVRATTQAQAPRPVQATPPSDAPDPTRRLPRPGSLLDIKV